jgi:hypothetical protein
MWARKAVRPWVRLKRRKQKSNLRFAPDERWLIGAVSPLQGQQVIVDFNNTRFPPAFIRTDGSGEAANCGVRCTRYLGTPRRRKSNRRPS